MRLKLSKFFLFAFFVFFPSQLGLHLWPYFSIVSGFRVDYLSPTLYFTDLLIFVLLILHPPKVNPRHLLLFLMLVIINSTFAIQPLLTVYCWLRMSLYLLLFLHLVASPHLPKILPVALVINLVWIGFLAFWQFSRQSSIGGVWYWLGERPLSLLLPNVAKISLGNLGLFLRGYAVFPHPNALAGFLLVSFWLLKNRFRQNWVYLIVAVIFITFSRSVILITFLTLVVYFGIRKSKIPLLVTIIVGLIILELSRYFGAADSLADRWFLEKKALDIIQRRLILGVGLGGFPLWQKMISNSFYLNFQPVHNIYLLIISQLGLPLSIYVFSKVYYFIRALYDRTSLPLRLAILSILLTGLVDHYWLTSPANTLIIFILTVVIYGTQKNYHKL
jgi:hypothetical protein